MPEQTTHIHTISALDEPSLWQSVGSLQHRTHVVVLLGVRLVVSAEAFLIGCHEAIGKARGRLTAHAQMQCHEAIVLKVDDTIGVVDGRPIERVAHGLPPVLPTRVDVVVVEVVLTADVV